MFCLMQSYRVGIVGMGEAAQILHLPSLAYLREKFEVTALCDVSRSVLDAVGDQWGVAGRYLEYRDLVESDDNDIVLVSNPSPLHYEVTMAAIETGKHVLVEKPMCYSITEAHEIAEAARSRGVTVQVGYMRRYAPAFIEVRDRVAALEPVRLARVHAVIGSNAQIISPTSKVFRGTDLSPSVIQQGKEKDRRAITQAIGDVSDTIAMAYYILLGLSSHDLSAMREIIGDPKRVLYAATRFGGRSISAAFDYGDYVCHFETGIDEIPRFDAHIEVYGNNEVVRVQYDTPYVRNLNTVMTVTESKGLHGLSHNERRWWGDNFTEEWESLHATLTDGLPVRTTPEDFARDLELFAEMVEHFKSE